MKAFFFIPIPFLLQIALGMSSTDDQGAFGTDGQNPFGYQEYVCGWSQAQAPLVRAFKMISFLFFFFYISLPNFNIATRNNQPNDNRENWKQTSPQKHRGCDQ